MKLSINNNNYKQSFSSITPIVANKGMLRGFKRCLVNANKTNYLLVDITQECQKHLDIDNIFGWAKYKDKEMGLLIVGDEFVKCKQRQTGWSTKKDVMQHIDRTPVFLTPESRYNIRYLMKRVDSSSNKI